MQYKSPPSDIHQSFHDGWEDFQARYDARAGGYHCTMRLDKQPYAWFVKGSQLSVAVLLAIPYEGAKIPQIGAQSLQFFDNWIQAFLKEVGLELKNMAPVN